jgi:hypothetical protein
MRILASVFFAIKRLRVVLLVLQAGFRLCNAELLSSLVFDPRAHTGTHTHTHTHTPLVHLRRAFLFAGR